MRRAEIGTGIDVTADAAAAFTPGCYVSRDGKVLGRVLETRVAHDRLVLVVDLDDWRVA